MKIILKITIILCILLFVIFNSNNVYAINPSDGGSTRSSEINILNNTQANFFDPSQYKLDDKDVEEKGKKIVTIIRNVGLAISVISLMILGIREMTASAEEKSVIKQSIWGYVIGVFMIVAITLLPSIIYGLTKDVFK